MLRVIPYGHCLLTIFPFLNLWHIPCNERLPPILQWDLPPGMSAHSHSEYERLRSRDPCADYCFLDVVLGRNWKSKERGSRAPVLRIQHQGFQPDIPPFSSHWRTASRKISFIGLSCPAIAWKFLDFS